MQRRVTAFGLLQCMVRVYVDERMHCAIALGDALQTGPGR